LVFDNLSQLLGRYQASLASYRVNRTRVLNALTTLSFFGGVGLVVFVAMLSLLNIPSGLRLWGPSLGVAAACIVIGAILMDPERLKPNQEGDVPFTSYAAPSRSPDDPGPPAAQPAAKPQARSPFSPSRFEVPQRSDAATIGKGAGTLVWRPLVSTDDEGRASVRLNLPTHPASCRLVVDAHAGPGRIASFTALIRSQVPSKPRGGTDSAAK
jgi:hypothetical protein